MHVMYTKRGSVNKSTVEHVCVISGSLPFCLASAQGGCSKPSLDMVLPSHTHIVDTCLDELQHEAYPPNRMS